MTSTSKWLAVAIRDRLWCFRESQRQLDLKSRLPTRTIGRCRPGNVQPALSKLAKINAQNVGKIGGVDVFDRRARGHEGSPLVINGTMYVHTQFPNKVFAIDLDTQKIKWRYEPKQDVAVIPQMCCDTVPRRCLRRGQDLPAAGR